MEKKTFTSRLDGKVKEIDSLTEGERTKEAFAMVSELWKEYNKQESQVNRDRAYKALKREYLFAEDLLQQIANHFESMDESLFFADILDGCDMNLEEAWDNYCDKRDCADPNPFID